MLLPTGTDRRSRPSATDGTTGDDRVGELAVEVAGLRDRIADKDSVIADLRRRLDIADRRLDAAAAEWRKVDELRIALADAVAAEQIAAGEAGALRALADDRRTWRLLRRLRWALRGEGPSTTANGVGNADQA